MKKNRETETRANGRWVRLIALVLAALLVFAAVVASLIPLTAYAQGEAAEGGTGARNQYGMRVEILDSLDAVRVTQTLEYTNQTGHALGEMMFYLFPNAYRRAYTAPFEQNEDAYPDGFTPAGVEFFSVEVDGQAADWGVQGEAECYLRVACDLQPGEKCTFSFGYELILSECTGYLGTGDMGWRLCDFYPLAAVWDEAIGAFSMAELNYYTQNVYADPADYTVEVYAPATYLVAAPGQITRVAQSEAGVTWRIQARDIRRFSMALSRRYTYYAREGDTDIYVYANTASGARALMDAAQRAAGLYYQWLGVRIDQITFAQADIGDGGYLFSDGLGLLDDSLFALKNRDALAEAAAELLARCYFGGRVGSNPTSEPWLTETVAPFFALMYMRQTRGESAFYEALNERVLPAVSVTLPGGVAVDSGVSQFETVNDFQAVMRGRGAASMYEIYRLLKEEQFFEVFKLYVNQNDGKIASLPDFAAALDQATGRELDYYLMEVLQNIDEYVGRDTDWYM